jgi:hypothetical protein
MLTVAEERVKIAGPARAKTRVSLDTITHTHIQGSMRDSSLLDAVAAGRKRHTHKTTLL